MVCSVLKTLGSLHRNKPQVSRRWGNECQTPRQLNHQLGLVAGGVQSQDRPKAVSGEGWRGSQTSHQNLIFLLCFLLEILFEGLQPQSIVLPVYVVSIIVNFLVKSEVRYCKFSNFFLSQYCFSQCRSFVYLCTIQDQFVIFCKKKTNKPILIGIILNIDQFWKDCHFNRYYFFQFPILLIQKYI